MTGTYRPRRLWRQIGGDDDSHGHEVLKAVVVVAVDLWVALVLVTAVAKAIRHLCYLCMRVFLGVRVSSVTLHNPDEQWKAARGDANEELGTGIEAGAHVGRVGWGDEVLTEVAVGGVREADTGKHLGRG